MRISELTVNNPLAKHYVCAKDIHVGWNKNKILVVLYSSKMHGPEACPQRISIEGNNYRSDKRHFCPFDTLREYMKLRGDFDGPDDPFFVFSGGYPAVTGVQVRNTLKCCLKKLNLDESLYDTHSFRIGMASDMM